MADNEAVESFIVEHESPLTAWGQVQRDLRRRIETGDFRSGARIPAEVELVTRYGVSRMTIRRAVESLVADGYLRRRQGSGTFVVERADLLRCDVDLLRPWREQLLATGHVALSRLVETSATAGVPAEMLRYVEYDTPRSLRFGRHVQEVDGIAIAVTESWVPERWPSAGTVATTGIRTPQAAAVGQVGQLRSVEVTATNAVEISFASAAQARLLGSYLDTALLVVTTCSRLRETGELVEIARTSWLGNRVRFSYGRELVLGEIDMARLVNGEASRRP